MKTTAAIEPSGAGLKKDCPPSVVLTMPFMPTMMSKGQLDNNLRSATEVAERRLLAVHRSQIALPVISRLKETIKGLNYATHHKSLILQVGPESAKTLYLDLPVAPAVLVDEDFHITDLTTPMDEQPPFLVMVLSSKRCKLYHYNGNKLHLIKYNASYSILPDKFLHHMDEDLSIILESYPLPVFVAGVSKVVGHFHRVTGNGRHIAALVRKNCMRYNEGQLLEVLQPYMDDWCTIRQEMAIRQLEAALAAGNLIAGKEAVAVAVQRRNNRLLVLENRFRYIPGAIDGMVEKVLESGGQVEWVDDGLLEDYAGMALVRNY